jgi:hypothetical protein
MTVSKAKTKVAKAPAKKSKVTTKPKPVPIPSTSDSKPGPGNPKSFKRPETAKQKKERKAAKSLFPAGTSDNDRYSVDGTMRLLGKDVGHVPKKSKQDLAMEKAKEYLPPPEIVHLDGSNEVLAQIEDEKLKVRVTSFLSVLLGGGLHKEAMLKNDFNWNMVQNLRHRYAGLHELWTICRDLGEEYRVVLRTDEGHRRAVEGVEEPIYAPSGKYLGSKTLYSDKLLEMLMKADSPEKFRERKEVAVTGTVLNIQVGFDRDELRKEQAAADVVEQEIVDE